MTSSFKLTQKRLHQPSILALLKLQLFKKRKKKSLIPLESCNCSETSNAAGLPTGSRACTQAGKLRLRYPAFLSVEKFVIVFYLFLAENERLDTVNDGDSAFRWLVSQVLQPSCRDEPGDQPSAVVNRSLGLFSCGTVQFPVLMKIS